MKRALMVLMCAGTAILAVPAAWAQGAPARAAPAPASSYKLPAWQPYGDQNGENNIANSNRTLDEMITWSQQTVADVLSFGPDDHAKKMDGFRKYFASQGWDLYMNYLKGSNIQDMVDNQHYFVSTIVPSTEIYSSGTKDGAYHWIVKMPITIGFYTKASPTAEPKPGPNGKFLLYIDVMRVPSGGDNGLAIVNWQVTALGK